jgi:hypothetical protein
VGCVEVGPLRAGSPLTFASWPSPGHAHCDSQDSVDVLLSMHICMHECMHAMASVDARCKPMF